MAGPDVVDIRTGDLRLRARLEVASAPRSAAAFRRLLPLRTRLIHARWSGEACWIPFGDTDVDLGYENHTSHPAPGQMLLYPGGLSEMEILIPYGSSLFASKVGQLAGNHFATVVEGAEQLPELGRRTLWQGAQEIVFESHGE